MNKPHKHAELIKAWANGATIQFKSQSVQNMWYDCAYKFEWHDDYEYRIKPESNAELVKQTLYIYNDNEKGCSWVCQQPPDRVFLDDRFCVYIGSIEVKK